MDAADVWTISIAAVSAVVAIVAAGVAIRQAGLAKRSAEATESQANTARESLALATAQKFAADRPDYELWIEPAVDDYAASLIVRMRSGPTDVELSMVYRSAWLRRTENDPRDRTIRVGSTFRARPLVRNQATNVALSAPADAFYISARTLLTTREIGGEGREWNDAEHVEWGDPNGGEHSATRVDGSS